MSWCLLSIKHIIDPYYLKSMSMNDILEFDRKRPGTESNREVVFLTVPSLHNCGMQVWKEV